MEYQTQSTLTTVDKHKRYKDFKKSPKSVTPEWRGRFSSTVKSKYTVKKDRQAGYGIHGFSNEGIIEYKSLKRGMDNLDGGLWVIFLKHGTTGPRLTILIWSGRMWWY